ncbi:MAG: hypothetical protein GF383_09745 [Candidatus Lokiarchaeota archaeon]|nr:hypothetical protein [Candidatus Lokiarchaeota archaeon]MBD3340806.1 hypothetical protein [Candidatus Lokiarchaeota archaeon]
MTSKKHLSTKKTSLQTISISPALKEWIKRYVNVKHQENPEDERFKSLSSFYTHVMHKTMEAFETGKDLSDFEIFVDSELKEFYGKFSTNLVIPVIESELQESKYSRMDYKPEIRFIFANWKFYMRNVDFNHIKSVDHMFKRLKKYYISQKTTRELRLDFINEKYILEYQGVYKNLHYLNSKLFAATAGVVGLKVVNFIYSESDMYSRFDLIETPLFGSREFMKNERFELIEHNLRFLSNFNVLINDDINYLWKELVYDENAVICFNSKKSWNKWIERIESDILEFGTDTDKCSTMLRFFEKMHWIRIENEVEKKFQIRLDEGKFSEEIEFLLDYFSKNNKIVQDRDTYYLE